MDIVTTAPQETRDPQWKTCDPTPQMLLARCSLVKLSLAEPNLAKPSLAELSLAKPSRDQPAEYDW